MNDFLAYLFGDSQLESEAEETREAIEQIMEEAEEQEPLKTKRTPLVTALKAIGLDDVDDELEYDPMGFSIKCQEEGEYHRYTRLLMEPSAMEKLAEMGWVVTRCGDVAMSNEPAEYRIRFIEISFINGDERPDDTDVPSEDKMNDIIKKGREFMSTELDRDNDELSPIEHPKAPNKKDAGVGDAKDGADPEGKPKTGKSKGTPKSESEELVDALMDVNEAGHKAGCQCGFCKNKGSFKKKKDGADAGGEPEEKESDPMEKGMKESESKCPVCHSTDTTKGEESGKQVRCLNCGNEFLPEAEEVQVPYIGKDKKQRMVPYIRRGKKKMGESRNRQR